MIPLLIFYLHTVGIVTIFVHQYQEEGVGAGMLGIAFVALVFSIGWSMSAFILKFLIKPEGFGRYLDRDALSLLCLTVAEGVLYYFFWRGSSRTKTISAGS